SGWWDTAIFYEVFIRSFNDSHTGPLANDGIGDIQGLIEKLDYLNDGDPSTHTDLGITALWLMPICPSPSYHGYDITDYTDIEPDYGTREDFARLMKEAHRRGIRIVIDLVLNHCSNRHPWFIEAQSGPSSAKRDWFIWRDEPTDYRGPWGERIWHRPRGSEGQYYYGMFSGDMPDLNYRNAQVTAAREIVHTWLTDLGADGFRMDAIRHLIEDGPVQENTPETHDWLRGYYTHSKRVSPTAFSIGEVWSTTAIQASYVGDQLDAVFEFELSQKLVDAVRDGKVGKLPAAITLNAQAFAPNQFGIFLTNHDQTRIMTMLLKGSDQSRERAMGKAKLAAKLLMLLPGIPFMYYGEEVGMVGDKPDPDIRTPMQWADAPNAGFTMAERAWKAPNWDAFVRAAANVQHQEAQADSLLSVYKQMIRLRQQHPALSRGEIQVLESGSEKVLAFTRTSSDGQIVLVVANLSEQPVTEYGIKLAPQVVAFPSQNDAIASQPVAAWTKGSYTPVDSLAPQEVLMVRVGVGR
ncbi:MAG: alpha-amylase family glycosyl hydrolase, partial [Planctomycetota bacterium]|nr:alpha-amylase family glycosyl hydrolase [Planctomycetota bacterium]